MPLGTNPDRYVISTMQDHERVKAVVRDFCTFDNDNVKLTEGWGKEPVLTPIGVLHLCGRWRSREADRFMKVAQEDLQLCEEGFGRIIAHLTHIHPLPGTLQCDRGFLRCEMDASYVEAAARYLRGISSVPPIFSTAVWTFPDVGGLESRLRAQSWAMGAAEASLFHKVIISAADWAGFCRKPNHGRFEIPSDGESTMNISPDSFPRMPKKILDANISPHLAAETSRMSFYFGKTVEGYANSLLTSRYEKQVEIETCVNILVSFLCEKHQGRIWDIRHEYKSLLKENTPNLPTIPYSWDGKDEANLGDFNCLLKQVQPWKECERIILKSSPRFEHGEGVLSGKKLQHYGTTLCFDASLLKEEAKSTETALTE